MCPVDAILTWKSLSEQIQAQQYNYYKGHDKSALHGDVMVI